MTLRRTSSWLALLGLLALGGSAYAAAKKIPTYDLSTEKGLKKAEKLFGLTHEGKVKAFPKKVVIPYFQVRYTFQSPVGVSKGSDSTTYTTYTLQLSDEDYTRLTDMLYADFVRQMAIEGIDVVPKEEMMATAAYQALEGEEGEKESGKRARYAASGMKNLPTRLGQPAKDKTFSAIAQEAGADSAVSVFVNIGICQMAMRKEPRLQGVKPCLRGQMAGPVGFDMQFHGTDGSDYRLYKAVEAFEYNKGEVYDAAIIAHDSAMTPRAKKWWQSRTWDAQSEAFVAGAQTVFGDMLTLAFYAFDKDTAKARAAAGVEKRTPPADEEPPAAAAVAAAPAKPADGWPVVPLGGVETCYFGKARVMTPDGKTEVMTYDALLRRGVDEAGGTIVEDSVSYTPGNTAHYVTKYTVAGAVADGKETGGMWTSKATYAPDAWAPTTWTSESVIGAMVVSSQASLGADGLTTTTTNTNDGKVLAVTHQALAPLDAAACAEKLKAVAPPTAGY